MKRHRKLVWADQLYDFCGLVLSGGGGILTYLLIFMALESYAQGTIAMGIGVLTAGNVTFGLVYLFCHCRWLCVLVVGVVEVAILITCYFTMNHPWG